MNRTHCGIETEKKYLIRMPDPSLLAQIAGFTSSEIEQIYLADEKENETCRIRKRTKNGRTAYTKTKKTRISAMSAVEEESVISADEYSRLSEKREKSSRPVLKKRLTFPYAGHLFEIDVYPFWKEVCVLEIELASEEEHIDFPPFLTVLADLTGDPRYSNASIAKSIPSLPQF